MGATLNVVMCSAEWGEPHITVLLQQGHLLQLPLQELRVPKGKVLQGAAAAWVMAQGIQLQWSLGAAA